MYDGGKIIPGLVIFLAIFTYPFWSNLGRATPVPKPQLPPKKVATECVAQTQWMRRAHMKLLDEWRNSVVRQENRIYVADNGKSYEMSLTKTCMACHPSKAKFCDQCHNYLGVAPYCWDCHLEPKESK